MFECLWLHTLHAKPRENEFKSFSGQCLSEYIRDKCRIDISVCTDKSKNHMKTVKKRANTDTGTEECTKAGSR
ncbi:hypothetical protein Tco_1508509, partial [Tanacetum coccineum]